MAARNGGSFLQDGDTTEPTHYATLRRDQLTSSRISLRQLGLMLAEEEERRRERQEDISGDVGEGGGDVSLHSYSPEPEEKEGRKKRKGGRDSGAAALGRLLPAAMVDHTPPPPFKTYKPTNK